MDIREIIYKKVKTCVVYHISVRGFECNESIAFVMNNQRQTQDSPSSQRTFRDLSIRDSFYLATTCFNGKFGYSRLGSYRHIGCLSSATSSLWKLAWKLQGQELRQRKCCRHLGFGPFLFHVIDFWHFVLHGGFPHDKLW